MRVGQGDLHGQQVVADANALFEPVVYVPRVFREAGDGPVGHLHAGAPAGAVGCQDHALE